MVLYAKMDLQTSSKTVSTIGMRKAKVGILIGPKGRGSNMLALAASCARPDYPGELAVVVSPREDTPAVELARSQGANVEIVDPKASEDYGKDLLEVLERNEVEYVCLAGYLRLLPSEILKAFPGRILNVHPALLPKFGGKGMYGQHVHEAVLASGESESGCTVHRVTENYDEGPPLLQMRCPVETDDTPETLALKVLKLEHQAFSGALKRLIEEDGK
jgi:phosphoribosylglycinamide formyltransferase-1